MRLGWLLSVLVRVEFGFRFDVALLWLVVASLWVVEGCVFGVCLVVWICGGVFDLGGFLLMFWCCLRIWLRWL